ncbi:MULTISPECIES: hypothetical protein [Streptomyces]|uniref:Lipoprotein n=2 Tax=Streptomyces TaxID=1883 RepID=A0ABU4KDX2_9ACTN|nr:hypothetical protein [Streptomyces roseolus]MDX2295971.1 hypothetical protein [Streptomyces roseolus]
MALRRPPALLVPLALVPLLVAGCSDAPASPDAPPVVAGEERVPDPAAVEETETETGTESAEDERERRAQEAVGSMDDPGFVESGSSPAAEGAHLRSVLEPGAAYRLSVACVGTGAVKVVVTGRGDPATVPCDGVPVGRRIADAPAELPVAITPVGAATGTVAWQIDSVDADADADADADGDTTGTPAAGGGDDDDHEGEKPRRKVRR